MRSDTYPRSRPRFCLARRPSTSPAQAYADRVWAGQSESADRPWRLSRVKEALEGQGLSMDGVELPD
jgi:hypothetical protein